jgi:hypothetical protein
MSTVYPFGNTIVYNRIRNSPFPFTRPGLFDSVTSPRKYVPTGTTTLLLIVIGNEVRKYTESPGLAVAVEIPFSSVTPIRVPVGTRIFSPVEVGFSAFGDGLVAGAGASGCGPSGACAAASDATPNINAPPHKELHLRFETITHSPCKFRCQARRIGCPVHSVSSECTAPRDARIHMDPDSTKAQSSAAVSEPSLPYAPRAENGTVVGGIPMAKLALIYGMRLLPVDDLGEVKEATVVLKNGRTARVAMHLIEGSKEEIEHTFRQSIDAFFEMYPEI